jgi:hypothetical protein
MKFKAKVSLGVDGCIELDAPDLGAARNFLEGLNPRMDQAVFERHIISLRFDDATERLRIESLEPIL